MTKLEPKRAPITCETAIAIAKPHIMCPPHKKITIEVALTIKTKGLVEAVALRKLYPRNEAKATAKNEPIPGPKKPPYIPIPPPITGEKTLSDILGGKSR